MLKRIPLLGLLALFAICLGACGSVDKSQLTAKTEITPSTPISTPIPTVHQTPKPKSDPGYQVIEAVGKKDDEKVKYEILYIQVTGLKDEKLQAKINSILKDEAFKVLNYFHTSTEESAQLDLKTTHYEVSLMTPDLISVQYWVLGMVKTAAHPATLFYTTNINMKNGEKIRLSDAVKIDSVFADKFLDGSFKNVWDFQIGPVKDFMKAFDYTNERVQKDFFNADTLDNIRTDKQSDTFSYFTPDSLGISIYMPYVIGGHAEFEIKYSDIKDNIKTDNEIWKSLLK